MIGLIIMHTTINFVTACITIGDMDTSLRQRLVCRSRNSPSAQVPDQ